MKTILFLLVLSLSCHAQYYMVKGDAEDLKACVIDDMIDGEILQTITNEGDVWSIARIQSGATKFCYSVCINVDTFPVVFLQDFNKLIPFYANKYEVDSVRQKVRQKFNLE